MQFRSIFLLSLLYISNISSAFLAGVATNAPALAQTRTSLNMCKVNSVNVTQASSLSDVANIFETSLTSKTSRRNLLKTLSLVALTPVLISNPAYAETSPDAWTQHKGVFTEDEIKDFTKTASGLLYKDVAEGKGPSPNPGDAVLVEMVGYIFESGDKWTNTYKGIPVYTSTLRAGARENQKYMKGLNEGVLTMKRGGKRILVIPAYLAYQYVQIHAEKDPSQVIIPGGANLVCYIECLDFKKV